MLLSAFGDSTPGDERIYISRRSAGRRKIGNEDELTQIFRKFDFRLIRAEELSFEEQVKLISRARYLVSNHGAGLTNMLFMRDGGSVLELRHVSDYINNCYFILASALDLKYYYQLCKAEKDFADPHTADLIVDLKELQHNLELF
jgi:capsular polysaccharide biosynthesis protein